MVTVLAIAMFVMMLFAVLLIIALLLILRLLLWLLLRVGGCLGAGPLDYFIQFPTVEPDTPAFGAVIYFYSLAFGDFEVYS